MLGGDVITRIAGKDVTTMNDIVNEVATHKPGDRVTLEIVRNGKRRKLDVKLAKRPATASVTPR